MSGFGFNLDFLETVDQVTGPEGTQFFFTNDDTIGESLRRYGEWARNELDYLKQFVKKGDKVLDIGCNIGTHTMFFADHIGSRGYVTAIDAQLSAAALTMFTTWAQKRKNINVLNIAMGQTHGYADIDFPRYETKSNFGAMALNGKTSIIPQTTLSEALFSEVNFIKMDVEGAELAILRGGLSWISNHRPYISCEIWEEKKMEEIIQSLTPFNYSFELLDIPAFNPENFLGDSFNIFGNASERLLMCKPKSKLQLLAKTK